MYAFLLTLLILDGLLLGAVVLLQAGQGGGLASLGGGTTDLVVGGRQAATLLTKMSWICGSVFLILALLISLVSPSRGGGSSEVLERLRQSAPASQPADLPLQTVPVESGGAQAPSPSTTLPLQNLPADSGSKAPAAPAKPGH
jgi:preprotein translocase subunit SecG